MTIAKSNTVVPRFHFRKTDCMKIIKIYEDNKLYKIF